MDQVLVILTNWRRPENVLRIIPAMRSQSAPVKIVVVDNAEPDYRLGSCAPSGVDDYWTIQQNHGPPCRFAPAMLEHDCRYILFYDDDCLPGTRAIEHLLETANNGLYGAFSTIGQIGRRYHRRTDDEPLRYVPKNVRRTTVPEAVDLTCRGHLVRANLMDVVLDFKWRLFGQSTEDIYTHVGRHDDILLCQGIQWASGHPSYLTPVSDDPERSLFLVELPDTDAGSARPSHLAERTQLVRQCVVAGWRSRVGQRNNKD